MAMTDAVPALYYKGLRTDTANTDAGYIDVPHNGKGYTVRRVTVYNSSLVTTGATANNATTELSVRGGAGGTGTVVVSNAQLIGLTGNTIVQDRTVAATGISPAVTDTRLYLRIGAASGVTNSAIDVVIVIEPLV